MNVDKEVVNFSEPESSPISQESSPGAGSLEIDERATPEREFPANNHHENDDETDVDEFAIQQRTMLERLKEQFSNFPFNNLYPDLGSLTPPSSEETNSELMRNEFSSPFSGSTSHKQQQQQHQPASPSYKKSSNLNGNQNYNGFDEFKQLNQLYEINDDPKRKEFLDDLFQFMKKRGSPITRLPIMAKSVLDLYELFKLVIARGGLVNVINKKLWQEIIKDLNLPSSITSAAFTLRTQYTKYLYPYECEKFNLSNDSELKLAIENNKRDGSRRASASFNQFQQQQQQQLQQPPQLQMPIQDMANSLAATVNPAVNLPSLNEVQLAQQKLMMMMLLYQQMLQQQSKT